MTYDGMRITMCIRRTTPAWRGALNGHEGLRERCDVAVNRSCVRACCEGDWRCWRFEREKGSSLWMACSQNMHLIKCRDLRHIGRKELLSIVHCPLSIVYLASSCNSISPLI